MSSGFVNETAEIGEQIRENLPNDIWQFQQTNLHSGTWSRISVRSDSPFDDTYPSFLPNIVSADSEGIARIITGRLTTGVNRTAIIRYKE